MRILLCCLLLVACKNTPYVGSANAKVVDDRVEIEVFGDSDTMVTVPGVAPAPLHELQQPDKTPTLPLDKFADGLNTVDLTFELRDGSKHVVQVSFDKPKGAGKPFLQLADCGYPSGAVGPSYAVVDGGPIGKVEHCWMFSDGTVHLRIKGSQGSKVTVGDKTADIGKDGAAELAYPVRELVLQARITTALGDGAGIAKRGVPVALVKGDTKLEGKLDLDLSRSAKDITRALLEAVTTGVPLTAEQGSAASPLDRTRKSLVYLPMPKYKAAVHHGKATAVAEVGLVAIARDLESRDGDKCGPYEAHGSGAGVAASGMAPHKLVDIEVDVFDTASGDKLTSRKFAGEYEECPMFASSTGGRWATIESRPSEKVVGRWLTQIAEKGAIP